MAYATALITGASSGIGEAFARLLPRETGLLLTGRDRARLDTLAQELGGGGRKVQILDADLSCEEGHARVIDWAGAAEIDLFICNAGLGRFGPLIENPPEAERETVMVNVLAPVVLCRALLPAMVEHARQRSGRFGVIVVTSAAAFAPVPLFATYAATKAFGLSFAESLANELADAPGDVLALCPGATRTRFFERSGFAGERLAMVLDAERVAREGLAMLGRRAVHVVGRLNQGYVLGTRFMPRGPLKAMTRFAMNRLRA